jgi:hypothetical protein
MLQSNNVDPNKEGCNSSLVIDVLLKNWFSLDNRRRKQELITPTSTQPTSICTACLMEVFVKNKKIGQMERI